MTSSFLIQKLRWIRGSSIFEFFIFLIAWGIFFGWWELDVPSSLLFLWVELLPRVYWKQSLPSGTHSSNEWIPWSWEAIQGGYKNIFFFFNCFIIALNTSFWCIQGWNMRDEMIFNRIYNDSLGSILSLIYLWLLKLPYWNTDPSQFLQGSQSSYTSSDLYSSLKSILVNQ